MRLASPSERAEAMRVRVFDGYLCVRRMWAMERQKRVDARFIQDMRSKPLVWWNKLETKPELKEIYEFAQRTLCASPSSCAAERSFSAQKRIIIEARNRMS